MQTANTRPVLKSIFENPVVKKYMQIPSFVGLNGKRVVGNTIILAFPLWIFENNLQMLDELMCGNALTLQNIHHSTTIDPSTGDIVPWAGRGRACVLATPTAVNYKQCYENLDRHRVMVCA